MSEITGIGAGSFLQGYCHETCFDRLRWSESFDWFNTYGVFIFQVKWGGGGDENVWWYAEIRGSGDMPLGKISKFMTSEITCDF